jgi:hypothetical protein
VVDEVIEPLVSCSLACTPFTGQAVCADRDQTGAQYSATEEQSAIADERMVQALALASRPVRNLRHQRSSNCDEP